MELLDGSGAMLPSLEEYGPQIPSFEFGKVMVSVFSGSTLLLVSPVPKEKK